MVKMKYPLVSVIIASFNRKEWLKKCLPYLKKLNYPRNRLEAIVVDDGSRDNTKEFLKKNFKWIKVVSLTKHSGTSIAKNVGIKNAKGDYFYFLDSDAYPDKDALIELVKIAEKDSEIGICGSKIVNDYDNKIQTAGDYLGVFGQLIHRGMNEKDVGQFNKIEEVFSFPSCGFLAKRDILKKMRYAFDPTYIIYYEDNEFCWRTKLLGYKVVFVPTSTVFHRGVHSLEDIKSISIYRTYRNKLWSFRKNFRFPLKQILLLPVSATVLLGIIYWQSKKKWHYGLSVFKHLFDNVNKDLNMNKISLKKQMSVLSLKI